MPELSAFKTLMDNASNDDISTYVSKLSKELYWLLQNLDSLNVSNLTADSIQTGVLVVGTNVGLGTAQDSSGVTTIIGNTVTTGFVNALSVVAGSVAAENITGTYITGKVIRSAVTGARVYIDEGGVRQYNSSNQLHGAQLFTPSGISEILMYYNGSLTGNITALSGEVIYDTPYGGSATYGATYTNIKATYLGFFGVSPVVKQSAALLATPGSYSYTAGASYTSNEQGMLNAAKQDINDLKNKVNGVIDKLGLYGLFTVT